MYNDYLPFPGMNAKTLQIRVSPVGTCSICLNLFTYIFFLFIIIITFYDNCFSLLLFRFFRGVGGGGVASVRKCIFCYKFCITFMHHT